MPSTIPSEISRISGNVSAALTAIGNKGVTVPSGSNSDDLADLIGQIQQGGGSGGIVISDTADPAGGTVRTITAVEIAGTKTINQNGTGIDVTEYAAVDVNVQGGSGGEYTRTVIAPQQTVTPGSDRQASLTHTGTIDDGDAYIVTLDGTEYFCTCETLWSANYCLGDVNWFFDSLSDYIYPFGVIRESNTITIALPNISQHTVTIEHLEFPESGTTLVPKSITANGTYNPASDSADGYSSVVVNVPSSAPNLQAKTNISPSTSSQTIQADAGYDGLSSVQINAMPSGAVTSPSTISGTAATVSTGTNTLTLTKTVSVTPNVTTAGYISSGTAGNASVSLTANVTTKGAATITPTTSQQTIASGTYLTGTQTIAAIPSQYIIPSGSQTITQNGTVDVTSLASVIVNISGGGGVGTLLNTTSLGSISSSSTQAASLNISLEVTGINNYDLLIVESSVNSVTNNRHTATVGVIFLTASSTVGTKNGATIATAKWNSKISSNGTTTTNVNTTAYGIYPNSCSVSSGTATIPMYRRYNSTSTGTINGTYTARVYGVNLYDLIGG